MTRRLRIQIASVAVLCALSVAPAHADTGAPPAGDGTTTHVPWNPAGAPPPSTITLTYNGDPTPGTGAAQQGTLDFGAQENGQSGPGGGGTTGGTGTGPPVACVPTGLIIDGVVHVPGFAITTGPTQGVVGVPTWFWTQPYTGGVVDPQPVTAHYITCITVTEPDGTQQVVPHPNEVTLSVDIWPASYDWDFGDGNSLHGECGSGSAQTPQSCSRQALGEKDQPQVQNLYESSSAAFDKGYPVSLHIRFVGRIGGEGSFALLGPFDQIAHANLPVREIQSVLTP